jgi:3-deoxy-7-phosphoheptulonate synthase
LISKKQIEIFRSIIEWREETKKKIFGMMLESHLEYGNQQIEEGKYGVSVTDPCLSFSSTRELIQDAIDEALLKGTPSR